MTVLGIKILGIIALNGFGSKHKTYIIMLYHNTTILIYNFDRCNNNNCECVDDSNSGTRKDTNKICIAMKSITSTSWNIKILYFTT